MIGTSFCVIYVLISLNLCFKFSGMGKRIATTSFSVYLFPLAGYGIVEGVRKSDGVEYCFRDMHSLSVGDIIVDHMNNDQKAYIVDNFGFKEIEFTSKTEERFVPKYEVAA